MSLPDGPLLLLAPHLDDAALSCAALLEREEPIDLVTSSPARRSRRGRAARHAVLPYASGGGPAGLRAEPFAVPVAPVAKARRIAVYASQRQYLEGRHEP